MTNVFTTPCISASVTMSPLAACATSCPSTASASFRVICCSKPVDTAMSELFLLMPVAKALTSGDSKTPTSGILMPASVAYLRTVSTNQNSVEFEGASITRTPIDRFTDHFEMASEMNEPPKPITAAKISNDVRSRPLAFR